MRSAIAAIIAAVTLTVFAMSARAGLDEGLAALDAGEWAVAVRELQSLAGQGDVAAQYGLGEAYGLGHDWAGDAYGPVSVTTCLSTDSGFSCETEQHVYEHGDDDQRDYAEASRWYRLAAEQGYAPAQNSLGVLYTYGLGVPSNHDEARRWFRLAARQGLAVAQGNLGFMYDRRRSFARAEALYRLAGWRWYDTRAAVLYSPPHGVRFFSDDECARMDELIRLWSDDPSLIE